MKKDKRFLRKHWSNIVFVVLILLVIIPQTRQPIQVVLNRIIAFSPTEINEKDQDLLTDYEWYLKNESDVTVNFITSKGKPVVVNYWATWCAPCIAELPSLEALYKNYKEDVDFYFITSEEPKVVTSFLEKRKFDIPVYYLLSEPPEVLRSKSLPTTFLIDGSGHVIMKKTGAANWNSQTVKATIDKIK